MASFDWDPMRERIKTWLLQILEDAKYSQCQPVCCGDRFNALVRQLQPELQAIMPSCREESAAKKKVQQLIQDSPLLRDLRDKKFPDGQTSKLSMRKKEANNDELMDTIERNR